MKECPCIGCEIKKHFARAWDLHWHDGEDCPYECPKYDEWKEGVDSNEPENPYYFNQS